MDLQLKGKRVLITGSSRGLGFAAAMQLSHEGAVIAINARDAQTLEQAAFKIHNSSGSPVYPIPADVSNPDAAQQIIQQAVLMMGGLDILITNAGGPPAGSFENIDEETWKNAIELSFLSQVRLIRAAIPYLKESNAPSILTITSISVKQPIENLILSNSIRAATIGLTKSLSLEYGKYNIRVNSILPGWTETERVQVLMKNRAEQNGTTIEEEIRKQSRECPLGRLGQPEEFARAATFLVSPAASYINGVMLQVDGGTYKGTL